MNTPYYITSFIISIIGDTYNQNDHIYEEISHIYSGGANAHEWQRTDDVINFTGRVAVPTTTSAFTNVANLKKGTEYAFFHKTKDSSGQKHRMGRTYHNDGVIKHQCIEYSQHVTKTFQD